MISQKSKYALRALLALAASRSEALTTAEIAEQQKIPRKFLEQILLDLKRDGLVQSRRGKTGGYGLLRPAAAITFGHVLRLIDGPLAPLPCLSRTAYRRCADCPSETTCEVRRVFARVAASARDVLDRTTIADALADSGPDSGQGNGEVLPMPGRPSPSATAKHLLDTAGLVDSF